MTYGGVAILTALVYLCGLFAIAHRLIQRQGAGAVEGADRLQQPLGRLPQPRGRLLEAQPRP